MSDTAENNYDTIGLFLLQHGYSAVGAAGVCGCIAGESGGNPEAVEFPSDPESGGAGLIQWTPASSMEQYGGTCAAAGIGNKSVAVDMANQLNAILAYNNAQGTGNVAKLNAQTGPVAAADVYSQNFERPAVLDSDVRPSVAQSVYAFLKVPTITPGFNGDQVALRVIYQPTAASSGVVTAYGTATVVPGVTTFPHVAALSTGSGFGAPVDTSVTFNGSQITISYPASVEGVTFATGPFNGYDFQTNSKDPPITKVALTTNIPGLTASNLSYTAHEIRLNETGLTLPRNVPGYVKLTDPPTGGGTPLSDSAQINPPTTTSLPTTMSFISENGSNQTISAHTSAETLLGSSQYGDTFQGRSANLNGDLIKLFGGNNSIDVTDLTFAHAALSYSGDSKSGMLSLSDGVHNAHIATGDFSQAKFQLASDMHGGTSVSYT